MRAAAILLVLLVLCAAAAARPKSTVQPDWHDEDLNEDRFSVAYYPAAALAKSKELTDIPTERWTTMTAANGSKYDCMLPAASKHDAAKARAARRKKLGTTLDDDVAEQLNSALGTECAIKPAGWWVYEVCWNRAVRQFHQNQKQEIETVYFLGKGPMHGIEDGADGELVFGESPNHGMYVGTKYHNGTSCDLNGQERTTELRLMCLEEDSADQATFVVVDITEPSTCSYLVWIKHRAACQVRELRSDARPPQEIACYQRREEE